MLSANVAIVIDFGLWYIREQEWIHYYINLYSTGIYHNLDCDENICYSCKKETRGLDVTTLEELTEELKAIKKIMK